MTKTLTLKKQHPQPWLFSTRSVLPCSRWACRQTLHQSFPSPVQLSLSLTDTGILLVPPGSTTKVGWRRTRGRPDGIPDWLSSIPPRPWFDLPSSLMPPRVEQGSFPRMFAKLGLLGSILFSMPLHTPEYSPDRSRSRGS